MSRCTLRYIFTVLLYAGVGVFLFPYVTGHLSNAILFLVAGIGLAVVCGVVRCCLTEGDCPDRVPPPPGHYAGVSNRPDHR
jgi:hypothetical protein